MSSDYLLRHEQFDEPQYISNFHTGYPMDSQASGVISETRYSEELGQNENFDLQNVPKESHGISQNLHLNLGLGLVMRPQHHLNLNPNLGAMETNNIDQNQLSLNHINQNHINHNHLNQNHLNLNHLNESHLNQGHLNQLNSSQMDLEPRHLHLNGENNSSNHVMDNLHAQPNTAGYRQYLSTPHLVHPRPGEMPPMSTLTLTSLAGRVSSAPPMSSNIGAHLAANLTSHIEAPVVSAVATNYIQPLADESLMANLVPIAPSLSQLSSNLPRDINNFGETGSAPPEYKHDELSRKVAPRSKDLYRVGPPFGVTNFHRPVYCMATNEQLLPQMECRLDRGFELGEAGNWIGYKRNYFTMVLAFTFQNWTLDKFVENRFQVMDKNDPKNRLDVSYFVLSVLARCSDPEVQIGLVQHTPKRDKGPQYTPPVYPAVPGILPDHETVTASSNKRNTKKIRTLGRIFSFDRSAYYRDNDMDPEKDQSILSGYPNDMISRVARFERIQFSASIRVKQKSNNVHKFFTLHVELSAVVNDKDRKLLVPVASCCSAPLLVRGRSPSNYPREKTSGFRQRNESG